MCIYFGINNSIKYIIEEKQAATENNAKTTNKKINMQKVRQAVLSTFQNGIGDE